MSGFDDRKDNFEKQFAHDQALQFKVDAKRNKMLGLWVAEKLGKSGDEAETYAKTVIMADLEEPGDEDVFRKVRGDLDKAGGNISDEEIRSQMQNFLAQAKEQVREGE